MEVIDMDNRDPENINNYVKVKFSDVIAENGVHSDDCVWKSSFKIYTTSRNCCYRVLAILFGIPAALLWGCLFAMFAFEVKWCITPAMKLVKMRLESFKMFYGSCVHTCFGPVFELYATVFSRINITLTKQEKTMVTNKSP